MPGNSDLNGGSGFWPRPTPVAVRMTDNGVSTDACRRIQSVSNTTHTGGCTFGQIDGRPIRGAISTAAGLVGPDAADIDSNLAMIGGIPGLSATAVSLLMMGAAGSALGPGGSPA